jgi:hypothetical protein
MNSDPPDAGLMASDDFASKDLEPPQLLWHYTRDFNGLKGILGGEIWASSLPYLNDMQEFRYGAEAILDALATFLNQGKLSQDVLQILQDQLRVRFKANDLFSASFSTEGDDLSQWRAYGNQAGPSFAVGFEPQALESHGRGYGFQLHQVRYDRSLAVADVEPELDREIDELNEAVRSRGLTISPARFARNHAASLMAIFLKLAPRYKHPKFAAEKEWRLIKWSPILTMEPRIPRRFRLSGSLVVPYLALPLHTPLSEAQVYRTGEHAVSPVSAIRIGPSVHREELLYAIGDMAARSGLNVSVDCSEVPFRNW